MKKLILKLSNNSRQKDYPIFIGSNLIEKIAELHDISRYSRAFIITNENVKPLFLEKVVLALPIDTDFIALPSGEKEKGIENVQKIWTAMHSVECDRKTLIINLGGGVITDMGGFVASTYMRGIDFLNIPTTLLAQVDASIGGKTGIDFSGIKNLIGTFDQPKAIIIDIQTLKTLPKRQLISGFAEIIKHGLIKDKKYFEKVTREHPLEFGQEELIDIIKRSCEIKAEIVESDETESGPRRLLNFGHTIGHAIEALSLETKAPFDHGEAISIGMWAEAKISHLMNLLSTLDLKRIQEALINAELPILSTNINIGKILEKIKSDKKNERGKVNFTLLEGIGEAVYNQNVSETVITQALKFI